jgi:hypothetical protein
VTGQAVSPWEAAVQLRPEQEQALRYVRRRGTEAPLAEIRSRLAATYDVIEALVEPLPAAIARTRPAAAAWCVQEVIDHLTASEQRAAGELAGLLAGESSATPIPAGLLSPAPLTVDWQELLVGFRRVHREILGQLDAATDAIPLHATAAVEMVVKCDNGEGLLAPVHWVEGFDWKAYAILLHVHNREHVAQIQRTLIAVAPQPEV